MDVFVHLLIILPSQVRKELVLDYLIFVSDTSPAGVECLDIDGWHIFLLNSRLPLIYLCAFPLVDSVSDPMVSLKAGDRLAAPA